MTRILRTYGFAIAATAAIWTAVGLGVGWTGLLSVVVLTVLEVTFSFDNAVVNAKLLRQLSPFWQRLFMTVGILVAVFVVRFALPILIVSLTADLSFGQVVQLAVHHPEVYRRHLMAAGPLIAAFGETFLAMIAIGFFFDGEKDVHWLEPIERRLARVGRLDNVPIFLQLVLTLAMVFTVPGGTAQRFTITIAAACGIALHVGLDVFGSAFREDDDFFEDDEDAEVMRRAFEAGNKQVSSRPPLPRSVRTLAGAAAIVMLIRLELLDASFSFDSVIGAFAITALILLIMAGLGAGAVWIRSMTVHLVQTDTLAKYRFLEHGAHYAIAALAVVMGLQLYGINLPDALKGSLGLVFIVLAVVSSIIAQRREERLTMPGWVGMVDSENARSVV